MSGAPRRGATALPLLLTALAVALLIVVFMNSVGQPRFHPEGTGPLGLSSAVGLMAELGATVDVIDPGELDAAGVERWRAVLVLRPDLVGEGTYQRWLQYADAGGALVIADETGASNAAIVPTIEAARAAAETRPLGECSVPELQGLARIDVFGSEPLASAGTDRACYPDGSAAYVVASDEGEGQVITFASPLMFTNARLHPQRWDDGPQVDNGPMLARLLGVGAGARVGVVLPIRGPDAPEGREREGDDQGGQAQADLLSVVPPWVPVLLVQGLLVVAVLAWAMGRRIGRVVEERHPVVVEASEYTAAVGDLLRRRRRPAHAARILRLDCARVLRRRVGLAPDAPYAVLVAAAAEALHRRPEEIDDLLDSRPIDSTQALIDLAAALDALRAEASGNPSGPGGRTPAGNPIPPEVRTP